MEKQDKQQIEFKEFLEAESKIDVRMGTVLEAEKVEKSDKLLRLLVDLGEEKPRQVVTNIGSQVAPFQLVERQFAFVVNLKPTKIMGLESTAMIVPVTTGDGTICLPQPPFKQFPAGAKLI
jgi:methionyl-tRNA synthetase